MSVETLIRVEPIVTIVTSEAKKDPQSESLASNRHQDGWTGQSAADAS
jgi:hypothetical protein